MQLLHDVLHQRQARGFLARLELLERPRATSSGVSSFSVKIGAIPRLCRPRLVAGVLKTARRGSNKGKPEDSPSTVKMALFRKETKPSDFCLTLFVAIEQRLKVEPSILVSNHFPLWHHDLLCDVTIQRFSYRLDRRRDERNRD